MKELQQIVNDTMTNLISEGEIQKLIEENVAKAVSSAIEDQFKSYGNVTRQIEEALKKGLQINTSELPFETYNQQMLIAIKTKLSNVFEQQASEKFMSEVDELIKPAPSEITAIDLVNKVVEFWKTDEPWDAEDLDDEATVELEDRSYGYSLRMWKQHEYSSSFSSRSTVNQPDLELFISNDGDLRINHKHRYNPTCFSEHEALIFKLYAAGTKVTGLKEFSASDCELILKEEEY